MIYETAIVLKADLDESGINTVKEMVQSTIGSGDNEVLITDDWGVLSFGQATSHGVRKGNYIYFMFDTDPSNITELNRKLRINENILKSIVVKLGDNKNKEKFVKEYKRPGSGSNPDERKDRDKERRLFAKKKSCWFTANKTSPDWKDPSTYAWLVNEFGKISPARITGLTPKFQRKSTEAIKRGRCVGLISYISNHVAR